MHPPKPIHLLYQAILNHETQVGSYNLPFDAIFPAIGTPYNAAFSDTESQCNSADCSPSYEAKPIAKHSCSLVQGFLSRSSPPQSSTCVVGLYPPHSTIPFLSSPLTLWSSWHYLYRQHQLPLDSELQSSTHVPSRFSLPRPSALPVRL